MPNKNNIPASHIQTQFWLLDKQGQDTAYHVVSAFQTQHLDITRFIAAVSVAIDRYSALNVRFAIEDGQLQQYAHQQPMELVQLSADVNEQAQALLRDHAYRPFDLANGPLIRLVLILIEGSDQVYVALSIHHIVIDLHSKELLAQTISSEYNGAGSSEITAGDNFADFPFWQQQWLNSTAADKARTYWQQQTAEMTRSVVMPEQASEKGYFELPIELSAELTTKLKEYCVSEKSDVFIVLLSAYYYLLSKFSGANNFSIGVPLSNRKQDQFKDTIGCFVNTLPLKIDTTDVATFSQLRQRTRMAMLGAHRHQELPLTEIVKLSEEGTGQRQIYNVGYTFEQPMQLQLDGAKIRSTVLPGEGAQLDCFLRLWFEGDGLIGRIETQGGFWTHTLAQRFSESLQQFLESLVSQKTDALDVLDYLSDDDQKRLKQFNQTDQLNLAGLNWNQHTLLTLFERQVQLSPDHIALKDGERQLSYRQFDQQSDQFAQLLLNTGVQANDVVALYSSRQIEMMVAVYGVLKTGSAYLPIDISLPGDRVQLMLDQAGVRCCVLGPDQVLPANVTGVKTLVCHESMYSSLPPAPKCLLDAEDAAYVIFTSGSTGTPKGVVNSHRGIVNRLLWMQDYFQLNVDESVLQKTPYSFDVSVWELFWPLQTGATLVLATHDSHKDPYQMLAQIAEQKINVIHFVPSMLAAFVDAAAHTVNVNGACLRAVICSGEELSSALVSSFQTIFPQTKLYNLYGPTEAAVDVSYWECDHQQRKVVPIGQPVANTQLYVVDDDGKQLPIGVVGELWIGGVQVAEGYINNLQLSEERFVNNPFNAGRVYKTGDYARWTESGLLEYLGRKDFQVKINGLRIELGEIENALVSQPGVSLAAVVVHRSGKGQRLVAYYSPEVNTPVSVQQLRETLSRQLPAYMVPSEFVRLDVFPLSSNGKVKRSALPVPAESVRQSMQSSSQPQTETEKELWQWWATALDRQNFGVDDSFFDLGGDSMLLMTLFQFIKQKFQTPMDSVDMFRFTTVRALAAELDGSDPGDRGRGQASRGGQDRAARMQRALKVVPRNQRTRMR